MSREGLVGNREKCRVFGGAGFLGAGQNKRGGGVLVRKLNRVGWNGDEVSDCFEVNVSK